MPVLTSSVKEFNSYLDALVRNKSSFEFERHKGYKTLLYRGNILKSFGLFYGKVKDKSRVKKDNLSEGLLKSKQIGSFFGMVRKSIDSYISSHGFYIEKIQRLDNLNSYFNYSRYYEMKDGDYFWAVDLDNSYWQAMYKLGILSSSTYSRYYRLHNIYKRFKAMSVGLSASERRMSYYVDGVPVLDSEGKVYEVKENKWQWDVVYQNVRVWSYNTIFECVKLLGGRESVISYNIDCLSFKFDDKDKASLYFQSLALDFKFILCRKLSDGYYSYGSELKSVRVSSNFK